MLPDVLLQTRFGFLTFAGTSDPYTFLMQHTDPQILTWNVRGLNNAARCLAVHETLQLRRAILRASRKQNFTQSMQHWTPSSELTSFRPLPSSQPMAPEEVSCCFGTT
jgi:hypothetical protein